MGIDDIDPSWDNYGEPPKDSEFLKKMKRKKLPSYWRGWEGYNEVGDVEDIRKRIEELRAQRLKEENEKSE